MRQSRGNLKFPNVNLECLWRFCEDYWFQNFVVGSGGRSVFETRGGTNRVFGKPCFCPLPKRGCFDANGKNDEVAFYPLKTRVWLFRPPKTTKMTKMAGVTQAKAWFRKKRGLFFPEKTSNKQPPSDTECAKNRAILCGCGGNFYRTPRRIARLLRPQDARFPLRRESLATGDFLCD